MCCIVQLLQMRSDADHSSLRRWIVTMQTPKPASTLVLCNVTTDWPHKVLLVKRSEQSAFLPGAHVFPGGRVDENDKQLAAWLKTDEQNFKRIANYFPEHHAVAEHLASAIRETLEETALSIAKVRSSETDFFLSPEQLKELLAQGTCPYKPKLDHLWPLSWWITPQGETRRYDTNFFLALMSPHRSAHCQGETQQPIWLHPKEALELYQNGSIFLAPPTRAILERMAFSASLADFISFIDYPIEPICPYFVDHNSGKLLVLPGDELHHNKKKSAFIIKTRYQFP